MTSVVVECLKALGVTLADIAGCAGVAEEWSVIKK